MTTAREKITRFYRGTEGEAVAARLVDLAEQTVKSRKFRESDFLDPYGMEIAETVAANYDGVSVLFDGGYPGAERQKAVFAHADFGGAPSFDIAVVRAEWNAEFARLSHRDVLGALTGLGVERDKIGDILVTAGAVRVLTNRKMAEFLLAEWTMIGAAHVSVAEDSTESITPREERTKEISATVASLRAHSVAAAGFGISRSRAASDIETEKLRLNWQPVKSASQAVKEGDVFSMRGRGRVEVVEVRGKTKKGRIGISLRRYL